MQESRVNEQKTGTEILIEVMDRLGKYGEAVDMLVIWTDEKHKARIKSNCRLTRALGLAHYAVTDLESIVLNELPETDKGRG